MNTALSELGRRTVDPPIAWLIKLTLENPDLISLAAGFTDQESLPVEEVERAFRRLYRSGRAARRALQYGTTSGDARLREFTCARLQAQDAVGGTLPAYSSGRVIITHGSQQFLYAMMEALCDPGDVLLVEDPSYFVFLGICQSHGIQCRGIPLVEDGLDLAALERSLELLKRSGRLPRLKMLYLVSYFQNPSSVTTSFAKKEAALELLRRYERAAGHPIYLLEDAAYRELRFEGPDVPSALAAKRASERVIYSGTYSKPFATGLRVGFGILPEELYEVVYRIKGNHDFGTAHLLQHLLAEAIASGDYERHLPELRTRYRRKSETMECAIRRHFPQSLEWRRPQGGLYFWVRTPKGIATGKRSKLFQQALASDVLYVPGALCYAQDETRPTPDREMRISYGGAKLGEISRGIERLGMVLRRLV